MREERFLVTIPGNSSSCSCSVYCVLSGKKDGRDGCGCRIGMWKGITLACFQLLYSGPQNNQLSSLLLDYLCIQRGINGCIWCQRLASVTYNGILGRCCGSASEGIWDGISWCIWLGLLAGEAASAVAVAAAAAAVSEEGKGSQRC
jgi:hypothetical protein